MSIVVPAYENSKYLDQTLESILAQTFSDFEVVVADHSSRDETQRIIDDFSLRDSRVRALTPTPSGGGAPANWNRVSMESRGELLKLVCGDDLLAPTCLEDQVKAFEDDPQIVLVAARRDLIDECGAVLARGVSAARGLEGTTSGDEAIRATVRAGTNIFGEPACVLMRRDALASVGWWDGSNGYYIDAQTYCRVIAGQKIRILSKSLASFRISSQQWSVRLVGEQARSAARFGRFCSDQWPSMIRSQDLILGNVKARIRAWTRRGVYLALDLRRGLSRRVER